MSAGMEQLRTALKAFGSTVITIPLLSSVLELKTESQKQVIRRRLAEMIKRGEVKKLGQGEFSYMPDSKPVRRGTGYSRMWRLIRVQSVGWTKLEITSLARIDRTSVDHYVRWLENEGYVERMGRNGNTVLWRTTNKGRELREAPWPKEDLPDPYATERTATASLTTLMLTANPDQVSTRIKIRKHLNILVNRFCTQDENTTNQGDPHA